MSASKVETPAAKRRPPNAGKGRKKGVPNKATKAAKDGLELAFEGLGGVQALTDWARENQTEFYKLWVKLIPVQVKAEHTGADGGPVSHKLTVEFIRGRSDT